MKRDSRKPQQQQPQPQPQPQAEAEAEGEGANESMVTEAEAQPLGRPRVMITVSYDRAEGRINTQNNYSGETLPSRETLRKLGGLYEGGIVYARISVAEYGHISVYYAGETEVVTNAKGKHELRALWHVSGARLNSSTETGDDLHTPELFERLTRGEKDSLVRSSGAQAGEINIGLAVSAVLHHAYASLLPGTLDKPRNERTTLKYALSEVKRLNEQLLRAVTEGDYEEVKRLSNEIARLTPATPAAPESANESGTTEAESANESGTTETTS